MFHTVASILAECWPGYARPVSYAVPEQRDRELARCPFRVEDNRAQCQNHRRQMGSDEALSCRLRQESIVRADRRLRRRCRRGRGGGRELADRRQGQTC